MKCNEEKFVRFAKIWLWVVCSLAVVVIMGITGWVAYMVGQFLWFILGLVFLVIWAITLFLWAAIS